MVNSRLLVYGAGAGLALVLISFLLFSCGGPRLSRASIDDLVGKLESGQVKAGMSGIDVLQTTGGIKPATSLVKRNENGDNFIFHAYLGEHEAVVLIYRNSSLFSAQHFVGYRRSHEKWYFCDTALLEEYVMLSSGSDS